MNERNLGLSFILLHKKILVPHGFAFYMFTNRSKTLCEQIKDGSLNLI